MHLVMASMRSSTTARSPLDQGKTGRNTTPSRPQWTVLRVRLMRRPGVGARPTLFFVVHVLSRTPRDFTSAAGSVVALGRAGGDSCGGGRPVGSSLRA